MACDSAYNHTGGWQFQGGPKMLELEKEVANAIFGMKKAIIGGAGDASGLGAAWEWFADPSQKPPRLRNTMEFLALTNEGIFTSFNLINWIRVDQKYYAIGSGMNFAAGALASGKNAYKAVEIAMQYDPSTNFKIYEYKL